MSRNGGSFNGGSRPLFGRDRDRWARRTWPWFGVVYTRLFYSSASLDRSESSVLVSARLESSHPVNSWNKKTLKHYFNRAQFFHGLWKSLWKTIRLCPFGRWTGRDRGIGTARVRRIEPRANPYGSITWALLNRSHPLHGFTDEHFCRD